MPRVNTNANCRFVDERCRGILDTDKIWRRKHKREKQGW